MKALAAAEASAVAAVAAAVGTLLAARVAVVVASAEVVASMPRVFGVVFSSALADTCTLVEVCGDGGHRATERERERECVYVERLAVSPPLRRQAFAARRPSVGHLQPPPRVAPISLGHGSTRRERRRLMQQNSHVWYLLALDVYMTSHPSALGHGSAR